MRDVLVVGGGGYVGSVLCRQLVRTGYSVRVLEAFLYGRDPLDELAQAPGFEVFEGDSRDTQRLARAMDGVDAVVHLGELVGDPACNLDPALTAAVNVAATRSVAGLARHLGVGRFIYPSSCSVYGASEGVVSERSSLNPVSLYARGKIAVERALLEMRDPSFHPVILRFATVYGLSPRPRFDLVVNLLTAKAYAEQVMVLDGGDQWRPFLHVSDAAAAIARCLEQPLELVDGQIFNVGSNEQNHTIRQIAELILERVPGSSVRVGAVTDQRNYRVTFDKIHQRLGFAARQTITDGIDEIHDALARGLIDDYRNPLYSNVRALVETDARARLSDYSTVALDTPVGIDVGLSPELEPASPALRAG